MNENKTLEQRVIDIEKTLEGINSDEFNTAIDSVAIATVRAELDKKIGEIVSILQENVNSVVHGAFKAQIADVIKVNLEQVILDKSDKIVLRGFAILGKKALYLPIVGAKAIAKLAMGTWKAIPKVVKKSAPVTPEAEQQAQAATPAPVQA